MAKVLVVDDNQSMLMVLRLFLEKAGHEPILCYDGLEGLKQVEARKPDLIISDLMMPKMNGYQFCEQVRANPNSRDIPIIMLSARYQGVDKEVALKAGATDYLSKDTSQTALMKRIEELLTQSASSNVSNIANALIGVVSLRGGSGVTSLAVNMTVALSAALKTQAALIDLMPLGGHAALMLGLRPTSYVGRALVGLNNNNNLEELRTHFVAYSTTIHLLASASSGDAVVFSLDPLKKLTALLQSNFPISLFDLPRTTLESDLAPLLKSFSKIVLVLSPDIPSIQSTFLALQILNKQGVPDDRIILVVNETMPQGGLPMETLEKALKRPLTVKIPFEPEMIVAINNRRPLLLHSPKSGGAAAIARLASTLV